MIVWIYFSCMLMTWVGFYFFAKEQGQFTLLDLVICVAFSFVPVLNFGPAAITLTYAIGKLISKAKFLNKIYYVTPFKETTE